MLFMLGGRAFFIRAKENVSLQDPNGPISRSRVLHTSKQESFNYFLPTQRVMT